MILYFWGQCHKYRTTSFADIKKDAKFIVKCSNQLKKAQLSCISRRKLHSNTVCVYLISWAHFCKQWHKHMLRIAKQAVLCIVYLGKLRQKAVACRLLFSSVRQGVLLNTSAINATAGFIRKKQEHCTSSRSSGGTYLSRGHTTIYTCCSITTLMLSSDKIWRKWTSRLQEWFLPSETELFSCWSLRTKRLQAFCNIREDETIQPDFMEPVSDSPAQRGVLIVITVYRDTLMQHGFLFSAADI